MKDRAHEKELSPLQRLSLNLLWGFCCGFAYLPRWVRYHAIQPLLVALLMLIRYRRRVILINLERSFPEKSHKEHLQIMCGFYRTLAEVVVDTISLAGTTPERGRDFIRFRDLDEHLKATEGRDWVALASHFGCWEFFLLWVWYDPNASFMGVYHPLKSPVFECFYRRLRDLSPDIVQLPMRECVRYYLRHKGQSRRLVLGLISDQNPPLRPDSHWFQFLNQETVFFDGGEKLALRFHIPVYFVHVERVCAGRYEAWFEQVYDGESEVEDNVITGRYVELLEQMIRRSPELWCWSHRRWKHRRYNQHKLPEKREQNG